MREKINFDKEWMFHQGDIEMEFPANKPAAYNSAKTERMLWGPASKAYNTRFHANEKWTMINLPHDYVICGEVDEKTMKHSASLNMKMHGI